MDTCSFAARRDKCTPANLPSDTTQRPLDAYPPEPEESPVERVAYRLREAGFDTKRFVDIEDGYKRPAGHGHVQYEPEDVEGNYAVYPGDGLVLLDVDSYEDEALTEPLERLPETFTVVSPHGGEHRYYAVSDGIAERLKVTFGAYNPQPSWGEVRSYNQYVLGPGSQLTDCDKCDECAPSVPGEYQRENDVKIAEIGVETLIDVLDEDPKITRREETSESRSEPIDWEIPDVDDDALEKAEEALQSFYHADETTARAWEYLNDLLMGDYSKRGYRGDRSKAEIDLASKLYGIFTQSEYSDRAGELIYATITAYCEKESETDWGEVRKWVERGERHRWRDVIRPAMQNFDNEVWTRWRRKKKPENRGEWTGEYGSPVKNAVFEAVERLSEGGDYPTMDEVIGEALESVDRKRTSLESALRRLQREKGDVKSANLDPWTYVWYPATMPDPPDAKYIRHYGEKHDPDSDSPA